MKQNFALWIFIAVSLCGCATKKPSEYLDQLGWVQQEHGTSLAAVGLVSKAGRAVIRSGMRYDGERGAKLNWRDIAVAERESLGGVTIKLVHPVSIGDDMSKIISSDGSLVAEHLRRAVKVARSIKDEMRLLENRDVEVNIFTSTLSEGYMLDVDSDLNAEKITLIIGNPAPEFVGHHGWWTSALAGSIHELTHVHQILFLFDDGAHAAAKKKIKAISESRKALIPRSA